MSSAPICAPSSCGRRNARRDLFGIPGQTLEAARMSAPQNTIAIVYDYDQTLSPNYMQDEVLFPVFGIDAKKFWSRCHALVKEQGYDNELAYMKALLDYLDIDRPTTARLRELGTGLQFF